MGIIVPSSEGPEKPFTFAHELLLPVCRFTHTVAGMAAAAGRQWEAAEDHFRIALQRAESFPQRLEQAEIRRFYAMMLLDRAAPNDREKARTLLGESLESYQRIGGPATSRWSRPA